MNKNRSNRRIYATGQTADDFLVTNLRTDLLNRLIFIGVHCPVAGEAGQISEVLVEQRAIRCVVNFWMELNSKEVTLQVCGNCKRRVW